MFTHDGYNNHEKVFMFNDLGGRLKGIISIHSTQLGPALGGCRFLNYEHPNDALNDALRLSKGMTDKNTLANLPLGGGKSVLIANGFDGRDRKEIFECFGYQINELGGQYYTGIDVGTTIEDMKSIRKTTPYVCGIEGNLAESTAQGAFNAIRGVCDHKQWDITGITVAVQGLGKTGMELVKLLFEAKVYQIKVSDIVKPRVSEAIEQYGVIDVGNDIMSTECDILAPCALGGVISVDRTSHLHCKVICGIANNILAEDRAAAHLQKIGITFIPDFLSNAGGTIAACSDVTGQDHKKEVDEIYNRVVKLLGDVQNYNKNKGVMPHMTPLEAANNQIENRLNGS